MLLLPLLPLLPLLAGCGDPFVASALGEEPGLEQIRREVELHHQLAAAATSLEEMRAELDRYEVAVGTGLEVLRDEVTSAGCQRELPAMLAMTDGLLEVIAAHREAIEGAAVLADAQADCHHHRDAMLARIGQLDTQTELCGSEPESRARG